VTVSFYKALDNAGWITHHSDSPTFFRASNWIIGEYRHCTTFKPDATDSLRSAPAEKARPAPVKIMTRVWVSFWSWVQTRRLVEEIRKELAEGRRCQVFAVYTQKRDVTARLERILRAAG